VAAGQVFGAPAALRAPSVSCTDVENSSRTRSISACSAKKRSTAWRRDAASPNTGSTRGWASVRKGTTWVAGAGAPAAGAGAGTSASQAAGKTNNIFGG
jgi:hypothetical protein